MKPTLILPIRKNAQAFTCVLLIALFPVFRAQGQKASFGIKAGTAVSNCNIKSTEPAIETSIKTSVTAGLFVHIPLNKRFSIRPAIEFVSKGSLINKIYDSYNAYSVREHIKFNYLDLPVNLLYDMRLGSSKWFAGCGPVISFLLNKKVNKGVAGYDVGANILAGFEWPIGAAFIINYTHGLKNVSDNHYSATTIRNHYFGITLAYWFSIHRLGR